MEYSCPIIAYTARQIAAMPGVKRIWLFNRKLSITGETTSFKLAIIADTSDKKGLCHTIYLQVDCDLPFDVIDYTQAEWEEQLQDERSFASRIHQTGQVVYG